VDVLAAQEIVEHADVAGQKLAQFGAEAVEGVVAELNSPASAEAN
jgi:hypothetical protein